MTATQVRAELDRVDARWLALKRDVVQHIPSDEPDSDRAEFRTAFLESFRRWRTFYEDAREDWIAWGSNVTQAESFDAELDGYRTRYTTLTGRAPTNPTTSATGRRYRSTTDWGSVVKWVAGAAIVGTIGYVVTR